MDSSTLLKDPDPPLGKSIPPVATHADGDGNDDGRGDEMTTSNTAYYNWILNDLIFSELGLYILLLFVLIYYLYTKHRDEQIYNKQRDKEERSRLRQRMAEAALERFQEDDGDENDEASQAQDGKSTTVRRRKISDNKKEIVSNQQQQQTITPSSSSAAVTAIDGSSSSTIENKSTITEEEVVATSPKKQPQPWLEKIEKNKRTKLLQAASARNSTAASSSAAETPASTPNHQASVDVAGKEIVPDTTTTSSSNSDVKAEGDKASANSWVDKLQKDKRKKLLQAVSARSSNYSSPPPPPDKDDDDRSTAATEVETPPVSDSTSSPAAASNQGGDQLLQVMTQPDTTSKSMSEDEAASPVVSNKKDDDPQQHDEAPRAAPSSLVTKQEQNNKTTAGSNDKKKKRNSYYTPPQILCEALSRIFHRPVRVESRPEDGVWGGKGWKTRTSDYSDFDVMVLRLIRPDTNGSGDDNDVWTALCETVFPQVLENFDDQHILNSGIKTMVLFHQRSMELYQDGFGPSKSGDEGFLEFQICLRILQQWIIGKIVKWLRPEFPNIQTNDNIDEDNVLDLFTDEEDKKNDVASALESSPRSLEALFALLEEPLPIVTSNFLEAMFEGHSDVAESVPEILLRKSLARLSGALRAGSFSRLKLSRCISCVSNLMQSPSVKSSLSRVLCEDLRCVEGLTGKEIQERFLLSPLIEAAAYAVPPPGSERIRSTTNGYLDELKQLDNFPLCAYRVSTRVNPVREATDAARKTMSAARRAAVTALRVASSGEADKLIFFEWLGKIISSNFQLDNILKENLLATDGIVEVSASRSFLLGLTATLLSFCGTSLRQCLERMGVTAFDATYFKSDSCVIGFESLAESSQLFQQQKQSSKSAKNSSKRISGATHLFFLSCSFLRVALHSALRVQTHFLYRYRSIIGELRTRSDSDKPLTSGSLESTKPVVATLLGWKAILGDPEFTSNITDFALTQLTWLVALARNKESSEVAVIPDWMCREPVRFLVHLARVEQNLISPLQAEKAVESATIMLQLGASYTAESNWFSYSPMVQSSLIDVVSAFVRAGHYRAKSKQRARGGKKRLGFQDEEGRPEHYRYMASYVSLDKKDLAATVFASQVVREDLCPTLVRTFCAVDTVVGYDAEKDDEFSKFAAKGKINELLLRLWCHPSGECRASILAIPRADMLTFASSLASVLAVVMDFGAGAIEQIRSQERIGQTGPLRQRMRLIRSHKDEHAVSKLLEMRKLLAFICEISGSTQIAERFGGKEVSDPDLLRHVSDLGSMVVSLIDKLTSSDGGINPSLDQVDAVPTSRLLSRHSMMADAVNRQLEDLIRRRTLAKLDWGLDVSIICHTLLALAAKWHLSARKIVQGEQYSSAFLESIVMNEDCDSDRFEKVFHRLVRIPSKDMVTETDNVPLILECDGHIEHPVWTQKYTQKSESEAQKNLRVLAAEYQLTHKDLETVATVGEIEEFLRDLRSAASLQASATERVEPSQFSRLEAALFPKEMASGEDCYTTALSEWVISSESFETANGGGKFDHKYDSTARQHGNIGSGKILVKEARKCHKGLPPPSANASTFLCYAEERMDLCRCVLTGPVDTPYAHGLFVFDVYMPPLYPQIPPLVTFMTTGGGRIRFNPNLYTDGKVCLSLLGSTNAGDESQRWNPELSSLAQVMLSIQSQVLGVPEPYFNEGNGVPEMMRRTQGGRDGSRRYNNQVRLETLRLAVVAHLRLPPKGFEEVTIRHFSLCRLRIVVQARRWMLEARETSLYARYERVYSELLSLLSEKCNGKYASLRPILEDLEALAKLERPAQHFLDHHQPSNQQRLHDGTRSHPAAAADFNPWAVPTDTVREHLSANDNGNEQSSKSKNDDDDDDNDDDFYS